MTGDDACVNQATELLNYFYFFNSAFLGQVFFDKQVFLSKIIISAET